MKRTLAMVLALVLMLAVMLPTTAMAAKYEPTTKYVEATASVYVRSSPKDNGTANIIGSIREGVTLEYMGIKKNGFYMVKYYRTGYGKDAYVTGWVSAAYSTLTTTPNQTGTTPDTIVVWPGDGNPAYGIGKPGTVTATGSVNIRRLPTKGSDSLDIVKSGTKLDYIGRYYIDTRGVVWYVNQYTTEKTGWVSGMYVSYNESTKEEMATFARGAIVKTTGTANMRKQPNIDDDNKVFDSIKSGVSLTVLDVATDARGVIWVKVYYDGEIGWVSTKNLTITKAATAS